MSSPFQKFLCIFSLGVNGLPLLKQITIKLYIIVLIISPPLTFYRLRGCFMFLCLYVCVYIFVCLYVHVCMCLCVFMFVCVTCYLLTYVNLTLCIDVCLCTLCVYVSVHAVIIIELGYISSQLIAPMWSMGLQDEQTMHRIIDRTMKIWNLKFRQNNKIKKRT